MKPFE